MKSFRWLCAIMLMMAVSLPVAHGAVVINELYYDAPSIDTDHEFIELYNNGTTAVDLTGWVIEWAGSAFPTGSFTIPPGTTIGANDYLLIGGALVQSDFGVTPDIINLFAFQNGGTATDGVRITDGSGYYDTILYDSPNTNLLPGDDANPGQDQCRHCWRWNRECKDHRRKRKSGCRCKFREREESNAGRYSSECRRCDWKRSLGAMVFIPRRRRYGGLGIEWQLTTK